LNHGGTGARFNRLIFTVFLRAPVPPVVQNTILYLWDSYKNKTTTLTQ
jgi:hypothetical protein